MFAAGLSIALAAASLVVLIVIWKRWVLVPPEAASQVAGGPWTNRLGLILAIAWPIQCGVGLVLMD